MNYSFGLNYKAAFIPEATTILQILFGIKPFNIFGTLSESSEVYYKWDINNKSLKKGGCNMQNIFDRMCATPVLLSLFLVNLKRICLTFAALVLTAAQ